MDISIRPVAEADHPAIAALIEALGYPAAIGQVRARLERIARHPDHTTLVAVAEGDVVGMVGAYVTPSYEHDAPTGRITAMVVSDKAQRRGIGARLVAAAEDWVRAQGAGLMMLTSHNRRTGAHAFYRRLGYAETGKRFVKAFS